MEISMDLAELNKVAEAMVAPGRGILAADESSGTIKKRFDAIGAECTEDSRRDYREMLFRANEAMSKCISGVILYDETIRQKGKDGTPLVKVIEKAGSLPGIKVDKGLQPLPFSPGEVITEGLDGLRQRLVEYRELGAKFAKWRAVIDIGPGIPSYNCIMTNAHALARYAALCQEEGIVPIVEPEVLMDGDHDIDRCMTITEWTLKTVFEQLYYQRVPLEGMVLKPNMVISGKKNGKRAGVDEVAEKTVKVLKACVPAAVPGIAFLSGGQSDEEATAALAPDLQLWSRVAGGAAEGLVRQERECRRRATRLLPPRRHEQSGGAGQVEAGSGEEGGVGATDLSSRCHGRLDPAIPIVGASGAGSPGTSPEMTSNIRC
jgi:fructose-bisphosphate aldolase class I